jgi:hypothetical protein
LEKAIRHFAQQGNQKLQPLGWPETAGQIFEFFVRRYRRTLAPKAQERIFLLSEK